MGIYVLISVLFAVCFVIIFLVTLSAKNKPLLKKIENGKAAEADRYDKSTGKDAEAKLKENLKKDKHTPNKAKTTLLKLKKDFSNQIKDVREIRTFIEQLNSDKMRRKQVYDKCIELLGHYEHLQRNDTSPAANTRSKTKL